MTDAFSRCHPILNFFYFAVVLGFTMFIQHPVYLAVSFVAATAYSMWLNGVGKVLKINFLLTIPSLLIVALLNPMFNHYGVTPLLYIESNGNWVTLEALVYGIVLGCVLFIMILWFSCYNQIMTSDKFIYLFGRIIPAMSLMLSMALRFVPHFIAQLKVIRNGQKCVGMDVSNGKWFKKVRYALNMVSILVTWALENAIETADSMKSRDMGCEAGPLFLFTGLTGEISFLAESWLYFPLFLHTDVIMALLLPSIIQGFCWRDLPFSDGFRDSPVIRYWLLLRLSVLEFSVFCLLYWTWVKNLP